MCVLISRYKTVNKNKVIGYRCRSGIDRGTTDTQRETNMSFGQRYTDRSEAIQDCLKYYLLVRWSGSDPNCHSSRLHMRVLLLSEVVGRSWWGRGGVGPSTRVVICHRTSCRLAVTVPAIRTGWGRRRRLFRYIAFVDDGCRSSAVLHNLEIRIY